MPTHSPRLRFAAMRVLAVLAQSTVIGSLVEPGVTALAPTGEMLFTELCNGLSLVGPSPLPRLPSGSRGLGLAELRTAHDASIVIATV